MRKVNGLSMVALALAMALGLTSVAKAEEAKATGTITGKVTDAEGKPVKGAQVNAHLPPARGGGEGGARPEGGARGGEGGARPEGGARGGEGGGRRTPPPSVAKAETGEDGTYKLEKVPVGKIVISANAGDAGRGRTQAPIEVTVGQEAKAEDIKIAKRPPDGGNRRRGGEGGAPREGGEGRPGGEAKKEGAK